VSSDPEAVDEDGILLDVEVQSVDGSVPTREGRTADIDQFFGEAFDRAGANGKVKRHRKCKICV
jgi:hypothetical protein